MTLDKIFSFFVPKDKIFYQLFAEDAANVVATATAFNEMVYATDPAKRKELIHKISQLEHKGDEITHNIFKELGRNFITPFDREDIHYLATSLDDIVDYIFGSSQQILLYNYTDSTTAMQKIADALLKQTTEIEVAISFLKDMRNITRMREAIVRINSLENLADEAFDTAIGQMFAVEKDAIQLIKVKEILANIETATDKCEDVANVIESIIIKYA
jgi:hypothetical protein